MARKPVPHPGLTPDEQAVDGHVYDFESYGNQSEHTTTFMEIMANVPPWLPMGAKVGRWASRNPDLNSPFSFGGMQYRKPRNKDGELHFGYGGTLKQWMRQGRQYPAHWVDDVFDRRAKKMLAYCRADVLIQMDYGDLELRIVLTYLYGYPVATPRHRLRAPYGRENGHTGGNAVTLIWQGADGDLFSHPWPTREEADMIGGLCVGFGCHSWIARKVADCMFASGRYDCVMTVGTNTIDGNMTACMGELWVNVHRTDGPERRGS